MTIVAMPGLERRLKQEGLGETLFSAFDRGRYATDASSYQMMPLGIVVPRSIADVTRAMQAARAEGVSILPRGAGTSQSGQTVNHSLVIDASKHLNKLISLDVERRTCVVEPGIVLDELNRLLKPHRLWFPVDVSTASRATIGGMTGNNSCGTRSLRYGIMRDNVIAIDAILPNGEAAHFGPTPRDLSALAPDSPLRPFATKLLGIAAREAGEIDARFPKVLRRVGGYNLDAVVPGMSDINLAHILVGSEGTLAFSTAITLKLSPILGKRQVGICHFGSFYEAMDAAQHLEKLGPISIELMDNTMLELARAIPLFRSTIEKFVREDPEALLMVEFDEGEPENTLRMKRLNDLMGDLGFSWTKIGRRWGGVVEVSDPGLQTAIADVRASGLNIMMSMKDERKPVSFVEDCAVPLEHLAEYTDKLTQVFEKHGTRGTWYAHASVGCLHVRPVLNLKLEKDLKAMRAIAEEAFALVRAYKGSHSGEHGDGIVRSEFHESMFGPRLVRAFEDVKDLFDPDQFFNPGKIVRAPKFDDRGFLRFGDKYGVSNLTPALDWSAYPGGASGFQGAAEMCNNNGACRKLSGGAMCPSYRVTRNEEDVTRGRANSLRLALSGQLGADALASDEMMATLKLCVSCKACKRECPTGVDMAKMKIEVLAARAKAKGLSLRDRLIAYLPRYAPFAARLPFLFNLRDRVPGLAQLSQSMLGLAASRKLPHWRSDIFAPKANALGKPDGREVVLFADTFNRYFEPENVNAALAVLIHAGYRVHLPQAKKRPLCCGRTLLASGLVDEARAEIARTKEMLLPFVTRGIPIVGLEPSCIFTFRDEAASLLPGDDTTRLGEHFLLFEEFLAQEREAGRLKLDFGPIGARALLHGHCHQKAFDAMGAVESALRQIPGLEVSVVESSCCGMAGAFGYQHETIEISRAMAEQSLLPAVRKADAETLIVADGTSCRQQIADGAGRNPVHVAQILARSLAAGQKRGA